MVAMLLREIRYGINVGLSTVEITPFLASAEDGASFNFHIGNVNVDYSAASVVVTVPGSGKLMSFEVTGLTPGSSYALTAVGTGCTEKPPKSTVVADAVHGAIKFLAPTGDACTVTATKQ
jgi:hypothetical protein